MSKKRKKKNKARQNRLNKKNKRNAQKAKKRRNNKSTKVENNSFDFDEEPTFEQFLEEFNAENYGYDYPKDPDEDDFSFSDAVDFLDKIFGHPEEEFDWGSDYSEEDLQTDWMNFSDRSDRFFSSEDNSYRYPYNDRFAIYTEQDFYDDMKKYEHKKGKPTYSIEFTGEIIAYAYMSPQQLNYYFYWRDLARKGVFQPASFNYYYLYFTELLNLIGISSKQEALRKINTLYKKCINPGNPFELTDIGKRNLAQAVFDFAYLHQLNLSKIDNSVWQYLFSENRVLLAIELLDSNELILPFELINDLTEFDIIAKSKTYLNEPEKYKDALVNSVYLIDSLSRQQNNEGLLNYPSYLQRRLYFFPFENIYVDPASYGLADYEIHYNSFSLLNKLNGIVQEVENTFREIYRQRGKLRKFNTDEWIKQRINQFIKETYSPESDYKLNQGILPAQNFLENLNKPKKIDLDLNQIEKIRAETEIVQELLDTEEEKQQLDPLVFVDSLASVLSGISRENYSYLEKLEEFLASEDRRVNIQDKDSLKETFEKYEKRYLTEPLLITENDFKINDIYMESLKYLFKHKTDYPFLNKPIQNQEDSELLELYKNLDNISQEFLKILIEEPNNSARLEELAQKEMTMTDLIMDEINNTALLIIDDIILEIDENSPYIIEEYFKPIKEIIEMEKD